MPYLIKSFRGGLSDETNKGVEGSFKYGHNLDIHKRVDSLTSGSAMVTINETTINDLVRFFVPARDGSTYAFGSAGSIYAISGDASDPAVNFVYNDENGAIKGATEWKQSDGNNYLYWATNTSIARMILNGAVDVPWAAGVVTQDYKTTLDPAEWHTIKQASGQLAIANVNYLASIAYDGTFDPADLNIRPGNIVKTIEERDDYTILGSYRQDFSEEGHIWSWITTATNWVQKKRIPVQGVNALISTELLLLQGGDDGELFFSDFVNAVALHAIPGGGKVDPGGVSIENDLAAFGFYGGTYPGIYTYGRRMKNRPFSLNYQYRLAKTIGGSTISTIGAVAVVNGQLLASWGTTDGSTSDYGIDGVSTTTLANSTFEGLEFDNGVPFSKKLFNVVKLTMSPMPASTSVSVRFKTDKATSGGDSSAGAGWKYAVTGSEATSFSVTDAVEAIFSMGKPAGIYEVAVDLTPSGSNSPEVLAITTYVGSEKYDY